MNHGADNFCCSSPLSFSLRLSVPHVALPSIIYLPHRPCHSFSPSTPCSSESSPAFSLPPIPSLRFDGDDAADPGDLPPFPPAPHVPLLLLLLSPAAAASFLHAGSEEGGEEEEDGVRQAVEGGWLE